jgi:hypothetical protein
MVSDKYSNVYYDRARRKWFAKYSKTEQYCESERAAAKAADLILIANGKEPRNVMKRVSQVKPDNETING